MVIKDEIEFRKLTDRKTVIENMKKINAERLLIYPIYGQDLIEQVTCFGKLPKMRLYGRRCVDLGEKGYKWIRQHPKSFISRRKFMKNGYFHLGKFICLSSNEISRRN